MIDSFQGEHKFLSNFFIEPDHTHVEGEYQATKTNDPSERAKFLTMTPSAAKRYGQRVKLRTDLDWENFKLVLMAEFVAQKFHDHRDLKERLLATEDHELVEGNYWGDCYWGVCRGKGENHLGKILMIVRESLRG